MKNITRVIFAALIGVCAYLIFSGSQSEKVTVLLVWFLVPLLWGLIRGVSLDQVESGGRISAGKIATIAVTTTLITVSITLVSYTAILANFVADDLADFILASNSHTATVFVSVVADLEARRAVDISPSIESIALEVGPLLAVITALPILLALFDSRWQTYLKVVASLSIAVSLMFAGVSSQMAEDPYSRYLEPVSVLECAAVYHENEWDSEYDGLEMTRSAGSQKFRVDAKVFASNCVSGNSVKLDLWNKACIGYRGCLSAVRFNQLGAKGEFEVLGSKSALRFLESQQAK